MSDNDTASGLVRSMLDGLTESRDPGENEFLGDDGLIYCRECGRPVQCRVKIFGTERVVPCTCRCRQEEMAREKKRREEEEHRIRVQRLKANGIQDRHLLEWRFDTAEDTENIQRAKKYVKNWEKVRANNLGLLLWGNVGTGKSFLAACIANALIEAGVPVLMTNFSKILNQMGGFYSEERCSYIASFSQFPLLIIDDLGIERGTEYALEQVYAVIDERYKSGLPLIITTNLSIHELHNPEDEAHARIFSRVLEMCTPVFVDGEDRRKAIGKEKQETVREVLEI